MAQFCRSCGARLIPGKDFCPGCGSRLQQNMPVNTGAGSPHHAPVNSGWWNVLIIALAVIMAIEGVIAGVWCPGFLVAQPGTDTNYGGYDHTGRQPGNTRTPVTNKENENETDPEWSPPEIEEMDITYTEQEIASAHQTEMSVSPDAPAASAEQFTVDFGEWGLRGEDVFIAKQLPVHDFKKDGYSVQGYEFSLSSGLNSFPFDVAVTVPRKENDGDLVMFVSRNPETGENENEYFDITEDGSAYVLYTDHFSVHCKITIKDFVNRFIENVKEGDVSESSTREALGAFYYPDSGSWEERMNAPVAYNQYDVWKKISKDNVYLPNADILLDALEQKLKADGANSLELGSFMMNTAKDVGSKTLEYNDLINNTKASTADAAVETIKLMDKLSISEMSPGMRNAVNQYDALNSAAALPLARVNALSTIAGYVILERKINQEVEEGRFKTDREAQWAHRTECAGTILGIISTGASYVGIAASKAAAGTAVAASGPVAAAVGIICGITALGLYCYSKSQETPYDNLSVDEQNYRDYFARTKDQTQYRVFYYDYDAFNGEQTRDTDVGTNGLAVSNIKKISGLTEEQNNLFKHYVNEEMKEINGTGGIAGVDPRAGIHLDFVLAFNLLFRIVVDDAPEKVNDIMIEFFRNYANACWEELKESDYLEFCRNIMKLRGEDGDSARLPWSTNEEKAKVQKEYTDQYVRELFTASSEQIARMFECYTRDAQIGADQMIRKELVPLLNTKMEFTVEDNSLDNPRDFSKSIYNQPLEENGLREMYHTDTGSYIDYSKDYDSPMYFCVRDENDVYTRVGVPLFVPSRNISKHYQDYGNVTVGLSLVLTDYADYYPAKKNFLPAYDQTTENTVFRCTYYHYLMMGAPNAMEFVNLKEEVSDVEDWDFDIPAPDEDGVIRVNVSISPAKEENHIKDFLGEWEGVQTYYPDSSWQHFDTKDYQRVVKLSLNEEQELVAYFYLYDGDKVVGADKYDSYQALKPGKGYVLSGSTLTIHPIPDAEGYSEFGGYYDYKLTLTGGSSMELSVFADRWIEEDYTSYKYENTCTLTKTK